MNAVGIDISKGKSMIAIMRPLGEIVSKPFEISHIPSELDNLANCLKSLEGETKIITEYTGKYYQPIDQFLIEKVFFVSIIHAKLIHDFRNNSIRKVKTDKADAIKQVNELSVTLATIQNEMNQLASTLPEYPIVLEMGGVGKTLGPQLIAEIGDIRRFNKKQSLVAFSRFDAPPFQSRTFEYKSRKISKRGSSNLRKTLFQVMSCLLQTYLADDSVYQFLNRKRQEGKNYYVYMVAGCNKFLRIYYARVKEYLLSTDNSIYLII